MEFELLKEFLESKLTLNEFSKTKQRSSTRISHKLNREIGHLLNTKIIDAEKIIGGRYGDKYAIRRNSKLWLKAINEYELVVNSEYVPEKDFRPISQLTVSEFTNLIKAILVNKTIK